MRPFHYILFLFASLLLSACQNSLRNSKKNQVYATLIKSRPYQIHESQTHASEKANQVINPPIFLKNFEKPSFETINFNQKLGRDYSQQVQSMVDRFYAINGWKTKWFGKKTPFASFDAYKYYVANIWKDGLDSSDYLTESLSQQVERAYSCGDMTEIKRLDHYITFSFFMMSNHVANGKINPEKFNGYWHLDQSTPSRKIEVSKLMSIQNQEQLGSYLDEIRPTHHQYALLQDKLIELQALKANQISRPVINTIPDAPILPGEANCIIAGVRKRLASENPVIDQVKYHELYDSLMVIEVKKFQAKNGLVADGELGKKTLGKLNRSIEDDIKKIRINLERLRWLPESYGENYILVNIPNYRLELFQNNAKTYEMRVIVGKNRTKTPIFSDTLEHVVFSPTWTVPNSIKVKEMLPKLRENGNHYGGKNYKFYCNQSGKEINPDTVNWSSIDTRNFNYSIVQQPGTGNALGKVKFVLPNSMNIYLHDTPGRKLFNKSIRSFSHGCIRLEEPETLAKLVLDDNSKFDVENISNFVKSERPRRVALKKQYHVQIEYRTAWVDKEGALQFRPDIYGFDKKQMKYHLQNALAYSN